MFMRRGYGAGARGRARRVPDQVVAQGPSRSLADRSAGLVIHRASLRSARGLPCPLRTVRSTTSTRTWERPIGAEHQDQTRRRFPDGVPNRLARWPRRYGYFNGAEGLLINSIILAQNCSAASAFACSLPPR
jgi:hypothetical protein